MFGNGYIALPKRISMIEAKLSRCQVDGGGGGGSWLEDNSTQHQSIVKGEIV